MKKYKKGTSWQELFITTLKMSVKCHFIPFISKKRGWAITYLWLNTIEVQSDVSTISGYSAVTFNMEL